MQIKSLPPSVSLRPRLLRIFFGTVRHGKDFVPIFASCTLYFDEATIPECARQCGLVLVTHADSRGDFACSLQRMFITIISAREAERKRLGQFEPDRRFRVSLSHCTNRSRKNTVFLTLHV